MTNHLLLEFKGENQYDTLIYNRVQVKEFFGPAQIILYIPYASSCESWNDNTQNVRNYFNSLGIAILGIHEIPEERIETDFDAFFIGDGTYENLIAELKRRGQLLSLCKILESLSIKCLAIGESGTFLKDVVNGPES